MHIKLAGQLTQNTKMLNRTTLMQYGAQRTKDWNNYINRYFLERFCFPWNGWIINIGKELTILDVCASLHHYRNGSFLVNPVLHICAIFWFVTFVTHFVSSGMSSNMPLMQCLYDLNYCIKKESYSLVYYTLVLYGFIKCSNQLIY